MGGRSDRLVAEHEHLVLDQRRAQVGDGGVVDAALRSIDATSAPMLGVIGVRPNRPAPPVQRIRGETVDGHGGS